uniref:Putative cholesterol transport protein n=1 Tax=Ixodes scapularis TaxID=6945 RepID=A0A4D5RLP0_IXOSC
MRSLIVLSLLAALASSTYASKCVTYGVCALDADTDKELPCSAETEPVPMAKSDLTNACPALATSDGKEVPVCCDAKQLKTFVNSLKQINNLGVSKKSACYLNFQNLICQSVCSPQQSDFIAVNASKSAEKGKAHVVESVYAISKTFAEGVYNSCKDTSTIVLGIKLMKFMCGKYGASDCSPERFLEFIGSTSNEGGQSPFKTHYLISEAPVTVNGKQLTPLDRPLYK